MKHKTFIRNLILATFALLLCSAATIYYLFFTPAFHTQKKSYIYIRPNDSFECVCTQIDPHTKTSFATAFKLLAKVKGYDQHLRSGRYEIKDGEHVFALMHRLATRQQSPVNLIVPSVRTTQKLAAALSTRIMLDSATIASALTDSTTCTRLGYNTENIVTLFIPDTYQVYWDINLEQFLQRMKKEHTRFWNEKRQNQAKEIGLTPNEVTILASIVDEETAKNDEKPIVAGLYLNRLKKGMLLQADPTVKFACGDFGLRRILHKHLTVDSPYNTYLREGLPPAPIRIPSISGIESVLNHAKHNYLYMCAKEDFSGRHNFAVTLREHQNNALRYQRELNRRNIK